MIQSPALLFVCTGNAARSVMGAALMRAASHRVQVTSAGTHSISGLPMSVRTRGALDHVGVADPDHRSSQLDAAASAAADLIIVFEPMHVDWIRRETPEAASRTASLRRLARELPSGPIETLPDRVATLGLAEQSFEAWEEVVDPAGGELADFCACASDIAELIGALAPKLDARVHTP